MCVFHRPLAGTIVGIQSLIQARAAFAFKLAEKRCLAMIGEVKRSCDQQTSRVLIGYRFKTNENQHVQP